MEKKIVLVALLKPFNIKTRKDIVYKAHGFDNQGPIPPSEITISTTVRMRQALCTPHELARLIHVLANPRHFPSLRKLHVKAETLAEYDR